MVFINGTYALGKRGMKIEFFHTATKEGTQDCSVVTIGDSKLSVSKKEKIDEWFAQNDELFPDWSVPAEGQCHLSHYSNMALLEALLDLITVALNRKDVCKVVVTSITFSVRMQKVGEIVSEHVSATVNAILFAS